MYSAEWNIPMQYEDSSSAEPYIWVVTGCFHSESLLAALSAAEMEASFRDNNMYWTPQNEQPFAQLFQF